MGFECSALRMNRYTDPENPPSREGLEDHQHWAWMNDVPLPAPRFDPESGRFEEPDPERERGPGHWRLVGTGLLEE